jgi:hypothetical protein
LKTRPKSISSKWTIKANINHDQTNQKQKGWSWRLDKFVVFCKPEFWFKFECYPLHICFEASPRRKTPLQPALACLLLCISKKFLELLGVRRWVGQVLLRITDRGHKNEKK